MLSEEELAANLRKALHAAARDIQPKADLIEQVVRLTEPDPPEPAAPRQRRIFLRGGVLAGGSALVAAAAVVLVLILGGSTAIPAYAVTVNNDGSIQITFADISGVSGLNARLRALHTNIVVVPMRRGCTTRMALTQISGAEHPATIRLTPHTIPQDKTVVLAAKQIGPNQVEMAIGRVNRGHAPSCVAPSSVGIGLGPITKAKR